MFTPLLHPVTDCLSLKFRSEYKSRLRKRFAFIWFKNLTFASRHRFKVTAGASKEEYLKFIYLNGIYIYSMLFQMELSKHEAEMQQHMKEWREEFQTNREPPTPVEISCKQTLKSSSRG